MNPVSKLDREFVRTPADVGSILIKNAEAIQTLGELMCSHEFAESPVLTEEEQKIIDVVKENLTYISYLTRRDTLLSQQQHQE